MKIPLAFLVVSSGVCPVLYWIVQFKGGRMPPGPLGLPIFGYLPFISSEPHKDFQTLAKYYGPIFSIRLRTRYAIIIDDIQVVMNILSQKREIMKKRRRNFLNATISRFEMYCKLNWNVLRWMVRTLPSFPNIQQKLRLRMKNVIGFDQFLVQNYLAKTLYARSVILEFFRWKTFSPLTCLWVPNRDILLNGFFIPKDSLLIANVWSINQNPSYWGGDVKSFKPERFLLQDDKRIIEESEYIQLVTHYCECNHLTTGNKLWMYS